MLLGAVLASTAALATMARATDYNITEFSIPGYDNTIVTGINNSGAVVGIFTTNGDVYHSFLQLPNQPTIYLQDPAALSSSSMKVSGINDSGVIVGTYQRPSGDWQSFEYDPTIGYTDIGSGAATTVNAITNTGQYFGSVAVGPYPDYYQAYLNYGNGSSLSYPVGGAAPPAPSPQEPLGTFGLGINTFGAMVGYFVGETTPAYNGGPELANFAYRYDDNGFSFLTPPDANGSIARGINDAGDIVGNYDVIYTDPDTGDYLETVSDNLLYQGGHYQTFYIDGAVTSDLYGINNAGVIVGDVQNPHEGYEGFIATPTTIDTTPGQFDRGPFAGFPSPPVPEPATWSLMLIGAAGLGAALRSRRRDIAVTAAVPQAERRVARSGPRLQPPRYRP